MAAGPGPVGFLAFGVVKFAGYTLAAAVLRKAYQKPSVGLLKVGVVRTAIGIVVGALFGGAILFANRLGPSADTLFAVLFWGLLIPIRMGEWSLLIHIFFDKGLVQRARDLKFAFFGLLWSFA